MDTKSEIFQFFNNMDFNKTVMEADKAQIHLLEDFNDLNFETIKNAEKTLRECRPFSSTAKILDEIWRKSGLNYFSYYSDFITISMDHSKWQPIGIIIVKLQTYFSHHAFYSVVSAALAAGCPIIVEVNDLDLSTSKCISHFSNVPNGAFSVTKKISDDCIRHNAKDINRIIILGNNYSEIKTFQLEQFCRLDWFISGNTAAILLEQCDINSAVDKILFETWSEDPSNMWAVSTVVVQESIYNKFLKELKFKIENTSFKLNIPPVEKKKLIKQIESLRKDAQDAGFEVLTKSNMKESEWSPTIILEYQDQDSEPGPAIKVVTCRTGKEGVKLLNNLQYSLGVSVWTQISSQALETASWLNCNNIWINSHGSTSVDVPLRPSQKSGNLICGGSGGIFQFMKMFDGDSDNLNYLTPSHHFNVTNEILSNIQSAQKAAKQWCISKERKSYMQKFSEFCCSQATLNVSDIMYYCHCTNIVNYSENTFLDDYFIIQKKVPIGIIALAVTGSDNYTTIIVLICAALSLGNAVFLVFLEQNNILEVIASQLEKILPPDVFKISSGYEVAYNLAQDESVQGFWMHGDLSKDRKSLSELKTLCLSTGKQYWFTPSNISQGNIQLFWHKCLKTKVIWLPKVDHLM